MICVNPEPDAVRSPVISQYGVIVAISRLFWIVNEPMNTFMQTGLPLLLDATLLETALLDATSVDDVVPMPPTPPIPLAADDVVPVPPTPPVPPPLDVLVVIPEDDDAADEDEDEDDEAPSHTHASKPEPSARQTWNPAHAPGPVHATDCPGVHAVPLASSHARNGPSANAINAGRILSGDLRIRTWMRERAPHSPRWGSVTRIPAGYRRTAEARWRNPVTVELRA